MKNIHLIICLFIFPLAVTAQNQSIDSLKNVLKKAPQDTVRVNVLNSISTAFIQNGRFDSANRYIKPSVDLLEKLHYKAGAIMAYHNLAAYNFHIKEYKTGKFFLLKSLNAALLANDKKNAAADYKELADLYELQSNFKQAKESKRKYALYSDSLAKEENAKNAAVTNARANLNTTEKVDSNGSNIKVLADNDEQKQPITYTALGVLLVLSVLIIWLLVSRAKNKAKRNVFVSEKKSEPEQIKIIEKPIQLKETNIEKTAFLQKIAEAEAQIASNKVENKQAPTEEITPIIADGEKKLAAHANVIKNIFEKNENGKQDPIIETAAINIETTADKIETKQKDEGNLTEKNALFVENKDDNIEDVEEKNTSIVIDRHYSDLISFNQLPNVTAKFLNDTIKLFWKTDDEKNIAQFEIEKSVDDIQYVSIETIAAKGFGSNGYETLDYKPLPGINYYRLKIIDTEVNFIYSPTVQVNVLPVSTLTLICYPTHVKDVIMVTAAGGKLPVLVNIFNKAGKKEFTIEVPPTTTPIYLTTLAAGIYTLQMKCQGKTILQQLVKM